MRFLYFTDTHIRGTTPKNRKDNFYETLKNKFREIGSLCQELEVDYILHGGDWFERPDISPSVVREFAILIKEFNKTIYTVAGNHDVFGHNPDTVNRTMLGILEGIGLVKLLKEEEPVMLEKDGIRVQLSGASYHYDMDGANFEKYYIVRKSSQADYCMNIVHGMLLQRPFYENVQYTLIDDIRHSEADVTFAGHYHSGFGVIERDGKYFINTGSIVRVSNSLAEMTRRPKVALVDLRGKIAIREIELKEAQPGEEVLDRAQLVEYNHRTASLQEFYQKISVPSKFQKIDIGKIIQDISQNEQISKEIKEEALRRIAAARERVSAEGEGL